MPIIINYANARTLAINAAEDYLTKESLSGQGRNRAQKFINYLQQAQTDEDILAILRSILGNPKDMIKFFRSESLAEKIACSFIKGVSFWNTLSGLEYTLESTVFDSTALRMASSEPYTLDVAEEWSNFNNKKGVRLLLQSALDKDYDEKTQTNILARVKEIEQSYGMGLQKTKPLYENFFAKPLPFIGESSSSSDPSSFSASLRFSPSDSNT